MTRLLADIRTISGPAAEAQRMADRLRFVALMRGERDPVIRLKVVPPAHRRAA